jgi:hypothetical protein
MFIRNIASVGDRGGDAAGRLRPDQRAAVRQQVLARLVIPLACEIVELTS